MSAPEDITGLLHRWAEGDAAALEALLPLVYTELRRLAARSMRGERLDHTLEATALVHEAFLRLTDGRPPRLSGRTHFFALAARMMRRILVDHARRRGAGRRGGGTIRVPLSERTAGAEAPLADLVALDEALNHLARLDERKARVIELRFFGGLEVKEVAEHLGVSVPTVVGDTRFARAWLVARMRGDAA